MKWGVLGSVLLVNYFIKYFGNMKILFIN